MKAVIDHRKRFEAARDALFSELRAGEAAALAFEAESSDFMRFNGAKVRQSGSVEQAHAKVKYYRGAKSYAFGLGLGGDPAADAGALATALGEARATAGLLPDDPYQAVPAASEVSDSIRRGALLKPDEIPARVLGPAEGMDYVGIYSQGAVCRGAANSSGASHWYESDSFLCDYSAWLPNGRAVKSSYAGRDWDDQAYGRQLADTRRSLEALRQPAVELKPGAYRAYVTPDALNELIVFFSWNGLGERGIRQGRSAYLALREGRDSLSPLFSLEQDFSLGVEPAFNDDGELAPERLPLIAGGRLVNTLVSSRSAKQYGVASNAAGEDEGVRSPAIAPGSLPEADALKALGTGVYVSNFHYLNWSDPLNARITGMTRFACLWVQDGHIVGPIKDMRWDESIYALLGSKLEALSAERRLIVENLSYGGRLTGGCLIPGIVVNGLSFTL